jgi:hypothetical protein
MSRQFIKYFGDMNLNPREFAYLNQFTCNMQKKEVRDIVDTLQEILYIIAAIKVVNEREGAELRQQLTEIIIRHDIKGIHEFLESFCKAK